MTKLGIGAVALLWMGCGPADPAGPVFRQVESGTAPYPDSDVVLAINWDTTTTLPIGSDNPANGSDQWRSTWADDDLIYSVWGDGGGFGGSNSNGRVSLGVGAISGTPPKWDGHNVWGGVDSQSGQGNIGGKAESILSIDGTLYMWMVSSGKAGGSTGSRIPTSTDHGLTWNIGPSAPLDELTVFSAIQFGQDYAGVPAHLEGYVYGYIGQEGGYVGYSQGFDNQLSKLALARVPVGSITDRASYEVFTGLDGEEPQWSSTLSDRAVVFEDPNNPINWGFHAAYNPHLDLHFLTVTHGGADWVGGPGLGVFVAAEPWGPWTTAYFSDAFVDELAKFTVQFPTKWMNPDGSGWAIHSGWPEYDGYFHLAYELDVAEGGRTTGAADDTADDGATGAGSSGDDAAPTEGSADGNSEGSADDIGSEGESGSVTDANTAETGSASASEDETGGCSCRSARGPSGLIFLGLFVGAVRRRQLLPSRARCRAPDAPR